MSNTPDIQVQKARRLIQLMRRSISSSKFNNFDAQYTKPTVDEESDWWLLAGIGLATPSAKDGKVTFKASFAGIEHLKMIGELSSFSNVTISFTNQGEL